MNVRSTVYFLAAVFVLGATGCASTIGNVSNLENATFEIGGTHKNEVADFLGFPASRETEAGLEYWGYRQKPELTGLIYAVPTGPTTVTTYQASNLGAGPARMDSAAVIYTFDADGILIDVFERDKD